MSEQTSMTDPSNGAVPPHAEAAAEAAIASVRAQVADVDKKVRDFVSERPVVALAAALACGVLLGRLLTR